MNSTGVSVTGRNGDLYRDIVFGTWRFHSLKDHGGEHDGKLIYAKRLTENTTLYLNFIHSDLVGGAEYWMVRF